ncbi:hypothetical protein GOODEAATRI_024612 [Goodea atripinnis]|uniref:Uncharacterized protein n=1 Tax=Goodea atripinnis TaxID=208336 RepID=A0ABV0NXE8_9TELE
MSLDCGRKPEYPVRTHACTGRTCKLHAERPKAGNQTQDLLAARQQCYQLRHRAIFQKYMKKLFFRANCNQSINYSFGCIYNKNGICIRTALKKKHLIISLQKTD